MQSVLMMKEWHGWRKYTRHGISLWFKGYLLDSDIEVLQKKFCDLAQNQNIEISLLAKIVSNVRGHFAFVVTCDDWLFAATDKLRSIPLFYKRNKGSVVIGNHAPLLADKKDLEYSNVDKQAALEISMSGYTMGNRTLCKSINQIVAGECLLFNQGALSTKLYYNYKPWKVRDCNESNLRKELKEIIWQTFEDMVKSTEGKQIAIPLSAGLDSRLVASILKELKVKDVVCFSYGTPQNFESKTAKQIADKLGYKWLSVPLSLPIQKKSFASDDFQDYWEFSGTLANAPVLIDFTAIKYLKEQSLVAKDAVFVNGNSGDFITGGHISSYYNSSIDTSSQPAANTMIKAFLDKHYSLWDCLKTENNARRIFGILEAAFTELKKQEEVDDKLDWAVLESMEYFGRQSKYVAATQRSYEYFQYEWRLPLWDPLFMDYWEGVPLKYKISQSLYWSTLREMNLGGVWSNIKVNDYRINSRILKYCRNLSKLFIGVFGKRAWAAFDRKVFNYFLDTTAATAIVPYRRVLLDTCGFRNRVSWIVEKYLAEHGVEQADLLK